MEAYSENPFTFMADEMAKIMTIREMNQALRMGVKNGLSVTPNTGNL